MKLGKCALRLHACLLCLSVLGKPHLEVSRRALVQHPLREAVADLAYEEIVDILRYCIQQLFADYVGVDRQRDLREGVRRQNKQLMRQV